MQRIRARNVEEAFKRVSKMRRPKKNSKFAELIRLVLISQGLNLWRDRVLTEELEMKKQINR